MSSFTPVTDGVTSSGSVLSSNAATAAAASSGIHRSASPTTSAPSRTDVGQRSPSCERSGHRRIEVDSPAQPVDLSNHQVCYRVKVWCGALRYGTIRYDYVEQEGFEPGVKQRRSNG